VADHFALQFLSAYSSELNPIERIWKLIRRRSLSNRYFPTLQDVTLAVAPLLRIWPRSNSTLQRLCAIAEHRQKLMTLCRCFW